MRFVTLLCGTILIGSTAGEAQWLNYYCRGFAAVHHPQAEGLRPKGQGLGSA